MGTQKIQIAYLMASKQRVCKNVGGEKTCTELALFYCCLSLLNLSSKGNITRLLSRAQHTQAAVQFIVDECCQAQRSSTRGSWSWMSRDLSYECADNLFSCHSPLSTLPPYWPPGSRGPSAGSWAVVVAPGRAGGCSPAGSCIEPGCRSGAACTPHWAACPAARSAPSWTSAPTVTRPDLSWRSHWAP